MSIAQKCSVENCNLDSRSLGYCKSHYDKARLYGDPLFKRKKVIKHCSVVGCDRAYSGLGYCKSHYDSLYLPLVRSPEYKTWLGMKSRCSGSYHSAKNYKDRGISVCDEWINDFKAFYSYVGDKPSPKHSLDRIDNDKGYAPGNVRWATSYQQSINRRIKNKNGYPGLSLLENGHFMARISSDGKRKSIGTFKTRIEAIRALKRMTKY